MKDFANESNAFRNFELHGIAILFKSNQIANPPCCLRSAEMGLGVCSSSKLPQHEYFSKYKNLKLIRIVGVDILWYKKPTGFTRIMHLNTSRSEAFRTDIVFFGGRPTRLVFRVRSPRMGTMWARSSF